MSNNRQSGDAGEKYLVDHIKCPNCGKNLMLLPPNYPLYDIQCTGCSFRAQIKTNNCKPKNVVFGAGWQIMDKVLKSGFMVPPLFLQFIWEDSGIKHREIRFYPFIPKNNLKKYKLSEKAKRANYWMFRYVGMNDLPYFLVYKE